MTFRGPRARPPAPNRSVKEAGSFREHDTLARFALVVDRDHEQFAVVASRCSSEEHQPQGGPSVNAGGARRDRYSPNSSLSASANPGTSGEVSASPPPSWSATSKLSASTAERLNTSTSSAAVSASHSSRSPSRS